jgi:hypothetical protein
MGLMATEKPYTEVVRNYLVNLQIPQTVRLDAEGTEKDLRPGSASYRLVVARQMIEDWGVIFGRYDDAADREEAVRELAHWINYLTPSAPEHTETFGA